MAKANNTIKANAITDLTVIDILPEGCAPELKAATIDIATSLALGISARRMLCAKLAYVADSGVLVGTTFTDKKGNADVRSYAHTVFGMQKTMAYNYASVGRQFLTPEGQLKDEYAYMSDCGASVLGLFVGMENSEIKAFFDSDTAPSAANVRAWKRALKSTDKSEAKDEAKSEAKSEDKDEAKGEAKRETKNEAKNEAEGETVEPKKSFYVEVTNTAIRFYNQYTDIAAHRPAFMEYDRTDNTSCALACKHFQALIMNK